MLDSVNASNLCNDDGGKYDLSEVRFHLHLPSPRPTRVQPSYIAKPLSTSSHRRKSTSPIYIERVN